MMMCSMRWCIIEDHRPSRPSFLRFSETKINIVRIHAAILDTRNLPTAYGGFPATKGVIVKVQASVVEVVLVAALCHPCHRTARSTEGCSCGTFTSSHKVARAVMAFHFADRCLCSLPESDGRANTPFSSPRSPKLLFPDPPTVGV